MYKKLAEGMLKSCTGESVLVNVSYFLKGNLRESLKEPIQNEVGALSEFIEQSQGLVERMTGRPIAEVISDPIYTFGTLTVYSDKGEYRSGVRLW